MKTPRRNKNKKSRAKNLENASNFNIIKQGVFLGISIERTVADRKVTKTDLTSWPGSVIVGFSGKQNSVLIEYPKATTSEADLDLISSFFSKLKSGDVFTIVKGTTKWSDGSNKSEERLDGEYRFLTYKNNSCIIAEKTSDFTGDMSKKTLMGKGFIRPIQFSKTNGKMSSSKKTSRITNFLQGESFDKLSIKKGDAIVLDGTTLNDGVYTILDITDMNNKECLKVSPPVKDEDLIGTETLIKVIQKNENLNKNQSRGPINPNPDPPIEPPVVKPCAETGGKLCCIVESFNFTNSEGQPDSRTWNHCRCVSDCQGGCYGVNWEQELPRPSVPFTNRLVWAHCKSNREGGCEEHGCQKRQLKNGCDPDAHGYKTMWHSPCQVLVTAPWFSMCDENCDSGRPPPSPTR
jgi:hypothetical protein